MLALDLMIEDQAHFEQRPILIKNPFSHFHQLSGLHLQHMDKKILSHTTIHFNQGFQMFMKPWPWTMWWQDKTFAKHTTNIKFHYIPQQPQGICHCLSSSRMMVWLRLSWLMPAKNLFMEYRKLLLNDINVVMYPKWWYMYSLQVMHYMAFLVSHVHSW